MRKSLTDLSKTVNKKEINNLLLNPFFNRVRNSVSCLGKYRKQLKDVFFKDVNRTSLRNIKSNLFLSAKKNDKKMKSFNDNDHLKESIYLEQDIGVNNFYDKMYRSNCSNKLSSNNLRRSMSMTRSR